MIEIACLSATAHAPLLAAVPASLPAQDGGCVLQKVVVANSSLPARAVAKAVRPFYGRQIGLDERGEIAKAVSAAYGKSDIALYSVWAPPVACEGGVLRLAAIEGYVARAEVNGRIRRNRLKLLQAYVLRIENEHPLRISTLQKYMSLIRDIPGFRPAMHFESTDAEGVVKLVIDVEEQRFEAVASVDNRGQPLLGRTQAQFGLSINDVVAGADQLTVSFATPFKIERMQAYGASYSVPLDRSGTTLTASASYFRTRPMIATLKGDGSTFAIQVAHPLVRDYHHSLYVVGGLDISRTNNALFGYTLSNDRARAAQFGVVGALVVNNDQFTLSTVGTIGHVAAQTDFIPALPSRGFHKVIVKAAATVGLGKAVSLNLRAMGQIGSRDLPTTEQMYLGGADFGRAYETAEVIGDSGYAGSTELAWRPAGLPKRITDARFYTFADGGRAYCRDLFSGAPVRQGVASAGIGARAELASKVSLQIELARGLTKLPYDPDGRPTRLSFSARYAL